MKVETKEQLKVMEFIEKNFNIKDAEIRLCNDNSIIIKGNIGDNLIIKYVKGNVYLSL